MNKFLIFLVSLPLVIAALLVNFVFSSDSFSSQEKARNAALAGNHAKAESFYDELLTQSPLDIELHRAKIRNHFSSPKKVGKNNYRDDKSIMNKYRTMARDSSPEVADLGRYGVGYIELKQENLDKALQSYLEVTSKELAFVNNSIGYVYLQLKEYQQAEQYFQQEIAIEGNLSGAYSNLSKVYLALGNTEKLRSLMESPATAQYLSERVIRSFYYQQGDYGQYARYAFKVGDVNLAGVVGAVLILLAWLAFLMWIDLFEQEKVRHVLGALALGSLFSMLCTPLYDFYRLSLGWQLNGQYLNDLLYCIFSIGLIEETVKIVPFLILLRMKQVINESIDYIIYASVCALGFAFMENLMYFHEGGLDNMLSRSLSATVLHMTLTSFVAYGLMYAKYRRNGYAFGSFVFAYLAAIVVHGVYDFWLVSDGWVGELSIISFVILFYAVQRYAIAIANGLSHSEFSGGKSQLVRSAEYLALALTLIAAYQYTVIGYQFGAENANMNFFTMLISSAFLAYILVLQLGAIQVSNGYWHSILKPKGD